MEQNIVHPLRIPMDILLELEESLVLCDTGNAHDSGNIHQDQQRHMRQEVVHKKVQSNVDLTYEIRNHLLRGRLFQFGQSLNEAWQLKRQFSNKISNPFLDQIYGGALEHGAIGGKLLGAGGGGFFLFYALPFQKHQLVEWLESKGLKIHPFRFDPEGLRAWSARESKHHQEASRS
jgi:D-glycero-alpha-D-manno-heptose-7-phosphate kinase